MIAEASCVHDDPTGMEALADLKNMVELAEEAYKDAQKLIYKKSIDKYGKFVSVKTTEFGTVFAKVTKSYDVAPESGFTKSTVTKRVDTKAINEFIELSGALPDGVTLKNETVSVQFRAKGEVEEEV